MPDNPTVKPGSTLYLTIEKLLYGGDGLAHDGSQACFVKDVIPGEKVVAIVEDARRQYLVASPADIFEPSPQRVTPACPFVKDCGGCQWQHIRYAHQLYWKEKILLECLERIAGFKSIVVKPAIASPLAFNYRHKATLKVNASGAIGYFREKSHDIVPVTECLLLAQPLNKTLKICHESIEKSSDFLHGVTQIDILLINESQQVMLSFKNQKTKRYEKKIVCGKTGQLIDHRGILHDKIFDLVFSRDTESFYQVNFHQNCMMIEDVLQCFAQIAGGRILDLYCGCGNFSLFLGRAGAAVTGVESNGFAVKEAQSNAHANSIKTCRFIKADVNRLGNEIFGKNYHGILLNPPRGGCSREILARVAGAKPGVIVYVSCNPSTLARDLKALVAAGYAIEEMQPFDMFPQTYHIETIVKLIRP